MKLLISGISMTCVAFFVSFFLNKISKINENSRAEKKFVVKSPFWGVYLGIVMVGCMIFFIYLYIREGSLQRSHSEEVFIGFVFALQTYLALYFILGTLPGIWETRVNGDDLTMVRFWVFKRYRKFSEITRINVSRNVMTVYTGNKVMFKTSNLNVGVGNFISRAKKAGIEITNITPKIDI